MKGGQSDRLPIPEQRPAHGLPAGELLGGQCKSRFLPVFPLELRPDDACGRLKNERSVPFGAGSPNEALTGFYCLPGDDQHRAADKVRAYHSAGHFGTETVERSGSNVGHRLCDRCFCHQLSFRKVEACPRELAALEQSVFSGCEFVLRDDISREKPGLP